MRLEEHDELGLPWDKWADGRVHRLAKGRDFLRSAEVVKTAAGNAARRLGKVAVPVVEGRGKKIYLWVQFVDHEIEVGEPCPCGSSALRRATARFAICDRCGATILLVEPRPDRDDGSNAQLDPLLDTLLAPSAPAGNGAGVAEVGEEQPKEKAGVSETPLRRKLRDPRTDVRHLGPFREIALTLYERTAGRERYYGRGFGPRGRDWLLVVDFALADGAWIASEDPGGWRHAVWGMPREHLDDLLNHAGLDSLAPDLAIDDPFSDEHFRRGADRSIVVDVGEALQLPPLGVEELSDVRLHEYMPHTSEIERYRGAGRLPDGEQILLAVRFRLRGGRRYQDPRARGKLAQDLKAVPLLPVSRLLDVAPLLEREPKLRFEDGVELQVDRAQAS